METKIDVNNLSSTIGKKWTIVFLILFFILAFGYLYIEHANISSNDSKKVTVPIDEEAEQKNSKLSQKKSGDTDKRPTVLIDERDDRKGNEVTKIEIIDRVLSEDGLGLMGVEIWCNNCIERYSTFSVEGGYYTLPIYLEKTISLNKLVEICFRFEHRKECILQHHKYLKSITSPKF